jgi:hypothetical protein
MRIWDITISSVSWYEATHYGRMIMES